MPFSHLILCCPLLLLTQSLPASESFPMSQLFSRGGQSTGVFSFSIIPSKEIPGLISFRMDWLDLLAVQGTLKSLLQQQSSKASILWHSAFFTVQLSNPQTDFINWDPKGSVLGPLHQIQVLLLTEGDS